MNKSTVRLYKVDQTRKKRRWGKRQDGVIMLITHPRRSADEHGNKSHDWVQS